MSHAADENFGSRWVWVFAAISALALHAALGVFAIAKFSEEDVVELGAQGIEIGIELASPQTPAFDLPPGPENEAAFETPAVMEQKEEVKEAQLPKDIPMNVPEPDRLGSENPTEKPSEEPDIKKTPAKPSEASVAQEATATPSVEAAQEAPKSVTIDPGTGQAKQRVRASWQRELIAHLDRHKRYPSDRAQKTADIVIALVLDRTGKVLSARILKGSGDTSFDEAALAMVRRADPVPAPPALVANDGLNFNLPVRFNAQK